MEELGRALTQRRNPHRGRSQVVPGRSSAKMRCSQERLAVRGVHGAHSPPAESQNRRLNHLSVHALINLKVRCRLRRQIPIGPNVHRLIWVLSVMKAITRICPPHSGHSNGSTLQIRAINTAHRPRADERLAGSACPTTCLAGCAGCAGCVGVASAIAAAAAPSGVLGASTPN